MERIKITSKGQITIPRVLRKELDIKEGMYLVGYVKDGCIILEPIDEDADKIKLLNYAQKESQGSIGITKVREITAGFNLKMPSQVRKVREHEAGING